MTVSQNNPLLFHPRERGNIFQTRPQLTSFLEPHIPGTIDSKEGCVVVFPPSAYFPTLRNHSKYNASYDDGGNDGGKDATHHYEGFHGDAITRNTSILSGGQTMKAENQWRGSEPK